MSYIYILICKIKDDRGSEDEDVDVQISFKDLENDLDFEMISITQNYVICLYFILIYSLLF